MSAGNDRLNNGRDLEETIGEMNLKNEYTMEKDRSRSRSNGIKEEETKAQADTLRERSLRSTPQSPVKSSGASQSPHESNMTKSEHEETVGGQVTVKLEPGQPPKLARSSSRKVWSRPAALFDDYPSKTEEAKTKFEVIPACIYGSKYMGSTEHGMDCDCSEEWGKLTRSSRSTDHDHF